MRVVKIGEKKTAVHHHHLSPSKVGKQQSKTRSKDYLKRMWQSLRKQLSTLRGIINELTPLVKHAAYPALGYIEPPPTTTAVRSIPYIVGRRALSTSSVESVRVSPVSSPNDSFRLVTGYYGISKDIFYGKSIPIFDKEKTSFGDDSW